MYCIYVCTVIPIYKDIYSLRENQEAENPFFMFSSLAHIIFTVARLFMDIPACFYFLASFLFLSFLILFTLLLSVPFFSQPACPSTVYLDCLSFFSYCLSVCLSFCSLYFLQFLTLLTYFIPLFIYSIRPLLLSPIVRTEILFLDAIAIKIHL